MSAPQSRPRALVAIVIYKCFTVGLLTCVAIGLFLTAREHDRLLVARSDLLCEDLLGIRVNSTKITIVSIAY